MWGWGKTPLPTNIPRQMAQRLLAPLHNSFQRHVADSVPVMRAVKQVCVLLQGLYFIAAKEPRGWLGSCGLCQCVGPDPDFCFGKAC